MNLDEFDKLLLPKSSQNENLETISRNKLLSLFPIEQFELRDEIQRDKWVDITIELKRNGQYLNFRFAIQLKATKSTVYNNDGPISFAVENSNINYLVNNASSAYYILYEGVKDRFYYENALDVYQQVSEKYAGKPSPKTFYIRFYKVLDRSSVNEMYNSNFEKGLLLRNLSPYLQIEFERSKISSTIIIDEEQKVYSVKEIIAYIENNGNSLLSQAKFKQIVDLELQ